MYEWARPDQLYRYNDVSYECPVFALLGVGTKYHIDRLFLIPLEDAMYPTLFMSLLENYEIDPEKAVRPKDLWSL